MREHLTRDNRVKLFEEQGKRVTVVRLGRGSEGRAHVAGQALPDVHEQELGDVRTHAADQLCGRVDEEGGVFEEHGWTRDHVNR